MYIKIKSCLLRILFSAGIFVLIFFSFISCKTKSGNSILSQTYVIPVEIDLGICLPVLKVNIDGYFYDFLVDTDPKSKKNGIFESSKRKLKAFETAGKNKIKVNDFQTGIYNLGPVDFLVIEDIEGIYVDGSISLTYLSKYGKVTLDQKNRKLILNDKGEINNLPERNSGEKISQSEKVNQPSDNFSPVKKTDLIIRKSQGAVYSYLEAEVNNKKLDLLLDTGFYQNTLLKSGLYKAGIKTIDGEKSFCIAIPEITAGGESLKNVRFEFNPTMAVTEEDGITGLSFFEGAGAFAIDYKNRTLESVENPATEAIPLTFENGHIFCNVKLNGKNYKALIDSGSQFNFIIGSSENELFSHTVKNYINSLYGSVYTDLHSSEELSVFTGEAESKLKLINIPEENIKSLFFELPGSGCSMILGGDFFEQNKVIINLDERKMWVEKN